MKKSVLTLIILTGLFASAMGQNPPGIITRAMVINGDTVPIYVMNDVCVFGPMVFQNRHDAIKFTQLIRNIKIVYPYARITAIKVKEYEEITSTAKSDQEKKRLMKKAEDDLRNQFEDDIKNLTDVQGVLLIKLIDRETGNTSYELIREFRGKVMAVLYQTLGKLFGYNLKMTYDPKGQDKEVEQIVQMIENGAL